MERGIKQQLKDTVLKEFIRRGYSTEGKTRIWNIANPELLYLTSEQIDMSLELAKEPQSIKDTEKELALFTDNFEDIVNSIGDVPFNLVDLGGGVGKIFPFIKKLSGLKKAFRYCPMDSSPFALKKSFDLFKKEFPQGKIKASLSNFLDISKTISELKIGRYKKNIFFLGKDTFGNFEPTEVLYSIRRAMEKGDMLFLTSGIHNSNWITRLKKYPTKGKLVSYMETPINLLGIRQKDLRPTFRFVNNRSEAVYTLKENKTFKYNGRLIELRKGDRIMTLISYKHKKEDLMSYLYMQFSRVDAYESKDKLHILAICKKQ